MSRKLTPQSTLENLKREAKRWLKALRAKDPAATARLERALPHPPAAPTLRDVQHALAREHELLGWTELAAQVAAIERSHGALSAALVTSLLAAANRGDAPQVAALLGAHPELVNVRAELAGHTGKRTALHFAMNSLDEAAVDVLLARGADPNIRDDGDNAYPIHFAAERGQLGIVRKLIEHGADPIGEGTMHELSVIGWAACLPDPPNYDVVEYLLAHGARHTVVSAVAVGATDAIRAAAVERPGDLNRPMDRTNHRRTPLHHAIAKRQLGSLETLLALGADAESRDAAGLTPLDQAALNRETAMVHALLAGGARVELPAAVALGRTEDIERLLGEDPGALRPGGRWATLIVRAAERSPATVIEALIAAGASANVEDDPVTAVDGVSGYTPLHAAAFHGNEEAVRALLSNGANVRARENRYCGSPASWAAYAGHTAVRDLILQGDIDMVDAIMFDRVDRMRAIFDRTSGSINQNIKQIVSGEMREGKWKPWWTPLAVAIDLDKPAAVRELLELGADPTERGRDEKSLLDLATEMHRDEIAAILREFGDRFEARPLAPRSREALVARFLTNACPDHHIRGGWSHAVARDTALRLLERHPDIARENLYTAVVCGELEMVNRMLAERPELARQKGGPKGSGPPAGSRFIVDPTEAVHPTWDPLLYLCFTRLDIPAVNENAVAIARSLLDHGAGPNSYFMAGGSRYSPLTGVAGEGEEDRPPHPRRNELAELLLDRGAMPYDVQVFYNIHFHGRILWYLEMLYERWQKTRPNGEFADPRWPMIDMGGYGQGARYLLQVAIDHDDAVLAEWLLDRGADPNAAPPRRSRQKGLYARAVEANRLAVAEVLARHGADTTGVMVPDEARFVVAALAGDRAACARMVGEHPELLRSTAALFEAARRDRADVVELLLDLGTPIDLENGEKERALHIAAYQNAVRVAELLIARGAEIDPVETSWGNTPIDGAIYAQHPAMIELLGRYSSDVWCLVFVGQIDRLRDVLREHPDAARASWRGWTLLMRLPGDEGRATEVATLLIEHGAHAAAKNEQGETAADLAAKRGMDSVAALLRNAEVPAT